MKKLFNSTRMIEEARAQAKQRSMLNSILIFLGLIAVTNLVQMFLIFPILMYFTYSDPKMIEMMNAVTPDIAAFVEYYPEFIMSIPEWFTVLTIAFSFVIIVGVIICCRFIDKRTVATVGLRKANVIGEYFVGFVIGTVLVAATALLCVVSGAVSFEGINVNVSLQYLAAYFVAYVIYGIAIELMYRGYYFTALTKFAGVTYSLTISSVVYMVMETANMGGSYYSYFNALVMGLVMGIYVIKRGNIWGAAAMHAAWSFCENIVCGFSISGERNYTHILKFTLNEDFANLHGGVYGLLNGVAALLVLFIALGLIYMLKENKNEQVKINEMK